MLDSENSTDMFVSHCQVDKHNVISDSSHKLVIMLNPTKSFSSFML